MAAIQLISIKRNEEASYFYEKKVPTALDSNRNEMVQIQENRMTGTISKKAEKEEQRKSKKEHKQKMKEAKQREKERAKSLKKSRKEVIGTVDRLLEPNRVEVKNDMDITINGGFQPGELGKIEKLQNSQEEFGFENGRPCKEHVISGDEEGNDVSGPHEIVVNEQALVSNENVKLSSIENEVVANERENLSYRSVVVSNAHDMQSNHQDVVLNQNEDLRKVPQGISIEHVPSAIKNRKENVVSARVASSSEEHGDSDGTRECLSEKRDVSRPVHVISNETRSGFHKVQEPLSVAHAALIERHADIVLRSEEPENSQTDVEETITIDRSETTEEVPEDFLNQPTIKPFMPEAAGAQHIEIEITEVDDAEGENTNTDQAVVVQNSVQSHAYQLSENNEGLILSSTVQQVEYAPDVDSFLTESYESQVEGYEQVRRKSVRFQDTTEEIGHIEDKSEDHELASVNFGASAEESIDPQHTLNPVVEIVDNEKRGEIQSSPIDLHEVFLSYEPWTTEAEDVPDGTLVAVVNGGTKVNGDAKFDNGDAKMVEINLNETIEHQNSAAKRKDQSKRRKLVRCCFP